MPSPVKTIAAALAGISCAGAATAWAGGGWPSLDAFRAVGSGANDAALIAAAERYLLVPPVEGARRMGAAWYKFFTDGLSIPIDRVALLRNNEVTRGRMRRQLGRLAGVARPGGTLWVVFVGHGAPAKDGKDGHLLGIDVQQRADSLEDNGLRRSELLALARKTRAARVVVLLDACFSGRGRSGQALVPGLQPLVVEAAKAPPKAEGPKTLVITAAGGNQFAGQLPGARVPAFSYLALGALRGWADRDADGRVSAGELVSYVRTALAALVLDREQVPRLEGDARSVLSRAWERGPDLKAMVLGRGSPNAASAPSVAAPPQRRSKRLPAGTRTDRLPAVAPKKFAKPAAEATRVAMRMAPPTSRQPKVTFAPPEGRPPAQASETAPARAMVRAKAAPPAMSSLAGTWRTTLSSDLSNADLVIQIEQRGAALSGSFRSSLGPSGPVTGRVAERRIELTLEGRSPLCSGQFRLVGVYRKGAIRYGFSGRDCHGVHRGQGVATRAGAGPSTPGVEEGILSSLVPSLAGQWAGQFSSNLTPAAYAKMSLVPQSNGRATGTFSTSAGTGGVVVAVRRGRSIKLSLQSTSASCLGRYWMTGAIEGDAMNLTFTGLDCGGFASGRVKLRRRR